MSRFQFSDIEPGEPARLVERIELIRSRLRLASRLEKADIDQLLGDFKALREVILVQSHAQRLSGLKALPPEGGKPSVPVRSADLGFEGVLGDSPALLDALEIVRRAAPTNLPILIDGESGTGKELFAKVIHANSQRADQPFISINCGAIPENLIESELFGHRKGAFTGATSDRKGRFEAADGGTIFLDEVGELPMQGQVKLLRVLQAHEIQRVGSDAPIQVDTRVVAATNRDLEAMTREGTFREDLYYRLSVLHATLPPLRERRDEIPLLCDYFGADAARELGRQPVRLSGELVQLLNRYDYPGNIRELRNLIFRVACLADGVADVAHLPPSVRDRMTTPGADVAAAVRPTADNLAEVKRIASDTAERRFLEAGLRATGGRVVDLAQKLAMNRSYLQTLLKKHGLQSKAFRPGASK
ncbi:MAG: sigma 54-interacting transcriptional regulator [Pseudomonadales bacterium]